MKSEEFVYFVEIMHNTISNTKFSCIGFSAPVGVEATDVAWNQLQQPPVHCKDVSVPLTTFSTSKIHGQAFET